MALVVGLSAVITQEVDRVSIDDVLGVVAHELLHAVPQGRDGVVVFVKTEHETVLLVVLLHEAEGVKGNIAVELDAGLHAPIVLVVHHQRVAEKEARLVTAHVSIALRVAVDDLLLAHVVAHLLRLVLVDPFGVRPVLVGDDAVMRVSGNQRRGDLLELVVELLVVQEDPVVVVIPVETVLDLSNGLGDVPHIGVACQGDKCRIHAVRRRSASACGGMIGVLPGGLLARGRHIGYEGVVGAAFMLRGQLGANVVGDGDCSSGDEEEKRQSLSKSASRQQQFCLAIWLPYQLTAAASRMYRIYLGPDDIVSKASVRGRPMEAGIWMPRNEKWRVDCSNER